MLEELHIKNYRCFEDVTFDSLQRVNLLAGRNNVGKTSVLEAIFLLTAHFNPSVSANINTFRGIAVSVLHPEEIWGWLFPLRDTRKTIQIGAVIDGAPPVRLDIALEQPSEATVAKSDLDSLNPEHVVLTADTGDSAHLVLRYFSGTEEQAVARAWIEGGNIKEKRAKKKIADAAFLSPSKAFTAENVGWFSALDQIGRGPEVVEPLKIIEPRLRGLSVQLIGGVPAIAGDIGMGRMLPVAHMGQGTGHLLTILLAIVSYPKGIVLIDEFENGFHHSSMRDIWKAIALASARSETQLFLTTHSSECIKAAHQAFEELGDDGLCFQRLERRRDGIVPVPYGLEALETTIEAHLEVR